MKRFLQRNSTMIGWLCGIGIPSAVGLTLWLVSSNIERAKVDLEYVKMALGVLNTSEKPQARVSTAALTDVPNGAIHSQRVWMQWAIRIINSKSPVPLTDDEQVALLAPHEQAVDVVHFGDGVRLSNRRANISGNMRTPDEVIRREFRQFEKSWYDGDVIKLSRQPSISISWVSPYGPLRVTTGDAVKRNYGSQLHAVAFNVGTTF